MIASTVPTRMIAAAEKPWPAAAGSPPLRILIVTDAWSPQVNGVVRTLKTTIGQLRDMGQEVDVIEPGSFRTIPCPTYPEIRLSLRPRAQIMQRITSFMPDVVHVATEGPLGQAARRIARRLDIPLTTAYHTRFPEYVQARFRIPLAWTYAYLRRFHNAGRAVLVPTQVVQRDLQQRGFRNIRLWSRGVDASMFYPREGERLEGKPPIFLYVGRVAVEKNIDAFLQLDLPGTKWVVGEGPELERIRRQYPEVRFLGVLTQDELAKVYSGADVFVFPSKTDTFGLVLIEALACGCPVAAYPVTGPLDVIGDSPAGALDNDLKAACLRALQIPRSVAQAHARKFTWEAASRQFLDHLRRAVREGAAAQAAA
ncbi:Glycosyltransferase involved in cell wall bisynthesis [Thiomonas bhubaneswarensis]|uniref:Glycosyltransferase involved in cell wall bisynthesis n=1 Tax=Thiomonas bhubaneswarensis TaxID=339866 RepID=A0A0K6HX98_9BURK|nr:Glycosyltransferase involved in cell wall bisynthesis [Thiomonas bhubaneswarensis]